MRAENMHLQSKKVYSSIGTGDRRERDSVLVVKPTYNDHNESPHALPTFAQDREKSHHDVRLSKKMK